MQDLAWSLVLFIVKSIRKHLCVIQLLSYLFKICIRSIHMSFRFIAFIQNLHSIVKWIWLKT